MLSLRKKANRRQAISMALVVLGGLMMLLASETWTGLLFMGLGVLIEIMAVSINHQD